MVLYAATTNPGKLRDFAWAAEAHLQGGEGVQIEPLPRLKAMAAPDEDGETFEANARLKAEYYSRRAPGVWVLADDSGLEVDALGGRPGVRSARFAEDVRVEEGVAKSGAEPMGIALSGEEIDQRNNGTLLSLMAVVPSEKRTARYRCVLALARDGEVAMTAEGALEGQILTNGRGAAGFGYDPFFWLPEVEMTMAEINPATRMQFSHRARALRALLQQISASPLIARVVR